MAGRVSGRIKRAITSSLVLFVVAVLLAASNAYTQNRDRNLSLGPKSPAQEAFFADLVERPDAVAFFKRFTPSQKLRVATNLRNYDNPQMIRLAALWLSDFDANARQSLALVLQDLAPKFPDVAAEMLGHTGGFQKVAVFAALRKSESATLASVADQLDVPERRANAVDYLVSVGGMAGPLLLARLGDKDREVQKSAADALGKIRYRPAASAIRQLYQSAATGDRPLFLAALANLGDPEDEPIFAQLLAVRGLPAGDRASVFLGLARIRTTSSVAALAREARNTPPDKAQILESLSLAGDTALRADLNEVDRLEVASGIRSLLADRVIASGISNPRLIDRAAELAVGRSGLSKNLIQVLAKQHSDLPGRTIESLVHAIASTESGRNEFIRLGLSNRFRGFMLRELAKQG